MNTPSSITAACLLLLLPARAPAQERFRETVVVTATATPVPFDNLARAVTVLTRDQIARLPARSIPDLLRFAASVDVRERGEHGMQADFSIRGASFGQTLVLVNGVRLNDAQSGHHNGDIPVPVEAIERIEVLYGAGSSLYGADAFGGTINIITRTTDDSAAASVTGGSFSTADGALRWSRGTRSIAAEATRSSGFTSTRDFWGVSAGAETNLGEDGRLRFGHVRKEFGAKGFYGASPSREWTDQTLATFEQRILEGSAWRANGRASYRTHGDRFLWDERTPGLFENRHRTHAALAGLKLQRALPNASRLTAGAEMGGDWITSTNLGAHRFARAGLFAEVEHRLGGRAVVYPGIRYDSFSSFGDSWSPSISASAWLGTSLKVRGAAGHAFRIPTFTELYYRDPAHEASGALSPETAWSGEAGADWLIGPTWLASATVFGRRERDVIDWVRTSAAEKWRTTNLRRVDTSGVELDLRRFVGSGMVGLQYAWLSSRADDVSYISKYVLEYARHSVAVVASVDLPWRLGLGERIAFTERADRRHYWVVDARIARTAGAFSLFVEGTNLLDTSYQEIIGVDMPGRAIVAGIRLSSGDAFPAPAGQP
jgi:iron complex outermembrane receptor protein